MLTPDSESKEPCRDQYIAEETMGELFPNVDVSAIGGEEGLTWDEMRPFWRAYHPWLAARGFHLFQSFDDGNWGYILPPPTKCPPALPYAIYGDIELDTSLQIVPPPKFAPARDSYMRDVMIKLTKKGSEEHCIYQDLLHCSELSGQDFQGVLPPVAILDSQHDFCFIVMPRWGDCAPLYGFETVSGVLSLMRCLLKSLAFLHSRRIVHRDIDFHNIMVNYYVFGLYREKFYEALATHRRGPDALHCLMDFDRSLKLPLSTSLDTCRLPADEAMVSGTPYQPPDLNLAEHDYNPFAYDVGCLGNMFRISYSDIVPIVPMLAPLFDQMTTHVVSERFRAADALAFFEDATRELPADILCAPVQMEENWDCLEDSTVYWAKLPSDFRATPGVYRTPPPSLGRRLLNAIAGYRIGWRILLFLRNTGIYGSSSNDFAERGAGLRRESEKLSASAQLKIHGWHKEVTVTPRLSIDGGRRAGSIQDQHLIHAITSKSAPMGGWPTSTPVRLNIPKNDGTIYTTVKVPHPNASDGVKLSINYGIVGLVTKAMTGTNYLRTEEQRAVSKRKDWYYVVQVGVQQTEWKWVQYGNWISVSALEQLHPQDPPAVAFHNHIVSTEGQANLKVVSATIPRNAH